MADFLNVRVDARGHILAVQKYWYSWDGDSPYHRPPDNWAWYWKDLDGIKVEEGTAPLQYTYVDGEPDGVLYIHGYRGGLRLDARGHVVAVSIRTLTPPGVLPLLHQWFDLDGNVVDAIGDANSAWPTYSGTRIDARGHVIAVRSFRVGGGGLDWYYLDGHTEPDV